MTRGAVTPGQTVALAVAVLVAATGGGLLLITVAGSTSAPTPVTVSATASANGTISLYHGPGPAVTVTGLRVVVTVDGERLAHQPPIPFFAATGFQAGPTGPFNSAADPGWTAGETASFTVAGTNHPTLSAGATVIVRIFRNDRLIAVARTSVHGVPSAGDDRRRRPVPGPVDAVFDPRKPRG